ncbi:MAG: radical SAM protein, partial [Bacillota bacterium]|nr:radical SAM protein [Bacillota bacterium]
MKITFILPAIGKKPGQKYIGTWKMEPLTIAVLQSLTPASVETEFFDDRMELINYETETDLVAITVETYTAKRSYQIAAAFRARGIPVVMGGYHVTLIPEEAEVYADSLILGNAEMVWGEMVEDARQQRLKRLYRGDVGFTGVLPDKRIFAGRKYLPISLVETGRGCRHACEFCAIASYYHCRYFKRSVENILADMRHSTNKYHFLVDDNLVADLGHARELFHAMTPLGIKWSGQGTLSMARDPELLKTMKASGCELILIGFESLEEENLKQMNKSWSQALGEVDELVERIHAAGIGIYATFVLGYDGDTRQSIENTVKFARKHHFYTAAFNHLLPFPGTALYDRLKWENRLLYDKWWLEEDYHYGELAFQPKNLSPEELSRSCRNARKAFARP